MQTQGVNSVVDQFFYNKSDFKEYGIEIRHVYDSKRVYTTIPHRQQEAYSSRHSLKTAIKKTLIFGNRLSESIVLFFKFRKMGLDAARLFLSTDKGTDVVLVQDVFAAYLILHKKPKIKVIFMTHMYDDEYEQLIIKYPHTEKSLIRKYILSVYKYVFNTADRVITICEHARLSICKKHHLTKDHVQVIYNAIRDEHIRSVINCKSPIKIVSASSLNLRKGTDLLIRFLENQSPKCIKNTEFHIYGTGDLYEELILLKTEKNIENLFVHGRVAKPITFYQDKDVFLVTSRDECLPMGIIEAMSAGMPVITTNVGAIREMVTENVNGWFIRPDTGSICEVIEHVIDNRDMLKTFGEASLRIYKERFSSERWVREFSKAFSL